MLVGAAGCPRSTRRTLVPHAEPLAVPSTGDAQARARFLDARSRFERDARDMGAVAADFEAIARDYPADPITPYALLFAGIAAIEERSYEQALGSLSRAEETPGADGQLVARSRLFLGIAENYLGRHQDARDHLYAGQAAIENDDERAEWLAAMAEVASRGRAPLTAVSYYDRWHELGDQAERAYVLTRLDALASAAGAADARAAYEELERRDGPAAAILGARVAADWAAEGRDDQARQIRATIEPTRRALGLLPAPGRGDAGHPGRLGAVLPLSGRRARAGDLAMRGLALAAGTFRDAGVSGLRPFEVSVRDSASEAAGVQAAVDALAGEGVIAVVGPIDGDSVDAAALRAHALGLPLLSLNPRSGRRLRAAGPGGSPYVFHVMQSAEDRAEALARAAHAQGARTFAVLRPDSGYGRVVGNAFAAEVERLGGRVVSRASYDTGTTSFGDAIKDLGRGWDAVFVPDQGDRLELITPALAAADLVSLPAGARAPKVGRKILLLSTAEFISPDYLRNAGRYSQGALLAPGFYPDRADPLIADFTSRYERAYGKVPTPLDAYAHDASLVVSDAIAAGGRTRADVGDLMAAGAVEGLTGTISFDSKRRRQDDGLLFTVMQDESGLAIRAMRN